ncbi:MAG: methylated-DNA--[protein]-cysteine S-methyltransferase [Candidatus Firestonebacteria bacterium]
MLQNEHAVKVKYGWIKLTYSDKGIKEISFPTKRKPVITSRNPPLFIKKLKKGLKAYFYAKRTSFSCPFDFKKFTKFQIRVWNAAKKIPYGGTRSYSRVARRIGKPGSARAVGNALGKNPCPIIIPCHRVIKNDGTIGGFSGAKSWKKILLDLERSK